MAIAFVRPQIISRADGRSAIAAAAYRAGQSLRDERGGRTFDYAAKQGVMAEGVITPKDAPEWMRDREQLWNAVERREDRSTRPDEAQLAREMVIALPHELDDEQRLYLVKNIGKNAARQGMVCDYAIHAPHRDGDDRNHHAHLMLSMRAIDPNDRDGFGNKARDWNGKAWLSDFKQMVEKETNRMLERAGVDERISFEFDAGEREAQHHMGHGAGALERRGIKTEIGNENRAIAGRNAARKESAERREIGAQLIGYAWHEAGRDAVAFGANLRRSGLMLAEDERGEFIAVNGVGDINRLTASALLDDQQQSAQAAIRGAVKADRLRVPRLADARAAERAEETTVGRIEDVGKVAARGAEAVLGGTMKVTEAMLDFLADFFTGGSGRAGAPPVENRREAPPEPSAAEKLAQRQERTAERGSADPQIVPRELRSLDADLADALRRAKESQRERDDERDRER